jgi:uridylate kinase
MRLVIKLSGKFFDNVEEENLLPIFINTVKKLNEEGHRIAIVTGGGETARRYISIGRKLNLNESLLDLLGIYASRLNAFLLVYSMQDICNIRVPETLQEFITLWNSSNKIVVAGGFQPAQSTSAVSALIAEAINADYLINLTNVDGVYDKDPRVHTNAKILEKVNLNQLKNILEDSQSYLAGTYELIDPLALRIIERSKIKVIVMNYKKMYSIPDVLKGKIREGTIILVGE